MLPTRRPGTRGLRALRDAWSEREFRRRIALPGDPAHFARELIARLERNLLENVEPFWLARAVDVADGGYRIAHDAQGQPVAAATRGLVAHARLLWLFSHLARSDYARSEHLQAAAHGYRFLRKRFWDAEHGGFFWELDAEGRRALRPAKHLYGQAFALYALAEYGLASADATAIELASECFALVEQHCHDSRYGGYLEARTREWGELPAGAWSELGVPGELKTLNTHLHLLEAFTSLHRASREPRVRARLVELLLLIPAATALAGVELSAEAFRRDWSAHEPDRCRVSYGHDLEAIWLRIVASREAGLPEAALLARDQRVFAGCLQYGYDLRDGGFFEYGPPGRRATARDKIWWVQAEALPCCLHLHRLTGDPCYLGAFAHTYDFIERFQVDWTHGEWHARITARGPSREGKGHSWKAGYHNGRALLESLRLLKALTAPRAG